MTEIKPFIEVNTLFDKIVSPICLKTERLIICDVDKNDAKDYYDLCTDDENNKFWGYDYRKDLKGRLDKEYFYKVQEELKIKKEEYSLAIKKGDLFVGEIVLWNMTDDSVEIGYRIKKEYQKNGYAKESVAKVIEYIFSILSAKTVRARIVKGNEKSEKILTHFGFHRTGENEKYYFYETK